MQSLLAVFPLPINVIIALLIGVKVVICTLNLNLAQLEYVADHLTLEACRKLLAALHDPNFDLTTNVEVAEWRVPQDESCLKLLLHWNSQPGEGRGETHVILTHRLQQLGHGELADWLSKSAFHQLGGDSQRAIIDNPFKHLLNETNVRSEELEVPPTESVSDNWQVVDTLMCSLIIALLAAIGFIRFYVCWRVCFKKFLRIIKNRKSSKETWIKMHKLSEDDAKSVQIFSDQQHFSESEEDIYSYGEKETARINHIK